MTTTRLWARRGSVVSKPAPTNHDHPSVESTKKVEPKPAVPPSEPPKGERFHHKAEDGSYEYFYTRAVVGIPGKLKVRMNSTRFNEFRTSEEGRRLEANVEILGINNTWREVTSKDFSHFEASSGVVHCGIRPWLAAFNRFFAKEVVISVNKEKPSDPRKVEISSSGKIRIHAPADPVSLEKLQLFFQKKSHSR